MLRENMKTGLLGLLGLTDKWDKSLDIVDCRVDIYWFLLTVNKLYCNRSKYSANLDNRLM